MKLDIPLRILGSLVLLALVLQLASCGGRAREDEASAGPPLEEPKEFERQLNPPVPVRLRDDVPELDLYVRTWPSLDKFMSIKAGAETHGLTVTNSENWVKVTVPGLGQKAYICRCYLEVTDASIDPQGLDAPCDAEIGKACRADMDEQFGSSQRSG
ncbi:MAG: hypothetical protein J4G06_00690 [Caldilineaceae bacterium]|nr:hypothetical protein [Caldilineaceae bacterium]